MKQFTSHSVNQTISLGESLAKDCQQGEVLAFFGGMGMGKTAFIQGLAKGLGISAEVTSPTFALVNEYHGDNCTLYHFDMYRIGSWEDLYSTGYFDYLETDAVLAIEWSENIENALPQGAKYICIRQGATENERQIFIGSEEEFNENFSD